MIINPQKAHQSGIITNIANPEKQVGSDGIDLTLHSIKRVCDDETKPAVLTENKKLTFHRAHIPIEPVNLEQMYGIKSGYILEPGIFDVTFNEGAFLKDGVSGMLLLRSTLIRNSCLGSAGYHDNNFVTDHLGMMLHIKYRTVLEHGMRIAQIILWQGEPTKAYDGTYNNQVGTDWQQTAAQNVKQK
jgi:deoxycytidine triphosphate deaminase